MTRHVTVVFPSKIGRISRMPSQLISEEIVYVNSKLLYEITTPT